MRQDGKPLSMEHYMGLYLGMERIKKGPDRVDVQTLRVDEDITGGYIIRYEHGKYSPGDLRFEVIVQTGLTSKPRNMEYIVLYPSKPKSKGAGVTGGLTPEQAVQQYLQKFMGEVELAFLTGKGDWESLVEIGAFIDYFLGTELTKNPDGYRGSIYMSKDVQGKLMMGPMWDYNEAFGTCCGYPIQGFLVDGNSTGSSGGSAISPQGWRFNICDEPSRCIADPIDGVSLWYRKAWQSADFRRSVASRWRDLRGKGGALSEATLANTLAAAVALTAEAAQRNYMRWSAVLSTPDFDDNTLQYKWSVEQFRIWLFERARWMDAQLATVM